MNTITAEKFDRLVEGTYPKVRDYVRSLCQNPQEAEDITQEAFLRAYRFYPTFDGRASFDTWVMTIARNQYFDSVRRANCRIKPVSIEAEGFENALDQIADDSVTPEACVMRNEKDPLLAEAINDLDETQRLILRWIAIEENTYSEVASRLHIPIGTVKSRYNRLIKAARRKYQELVTNNRFGGPAQA